MTEPNRINRKQRRLLGKVNQRELKITYRDRMFSLDEAVNTAIKLGNDLQTYTSACDIYRLILEKLPGHFQSLNNLAYLAYLYGDIDEALTLYRRAIHYKADYYIAHYNLGEALLAKGQIQEAEKAYLKTMEIKPNFARSLFSLSRIRTYTSPEHEDIARILSLVADPSCTWEDKKYFYFALGKMFDDCAKYDASLYDAAFYYYRRGNDICKQGTAYNAPLTEWHADEMMEIFSKGYLAQKFGFSSSDESPLFVVGMPRSGTTLISSILSNHPSVAAAGELTAVQELALNMSKMLGIDVPYPHAVRYLTPEVAANMVAMYQKRLRQYVPKDKRFVIDKHPINFRHLGLISVLFPKARIIHCTRNPYDICLSNYFQHFYADSDYSFDLEHTGHFYQQYAKMMAHWKQALPQPMLEVSYEDVVTDMEGSIHRMLAFLNLEWDDRCMSPHTNPRTVKTSSVWQVRQPVYRESLERWRHYEKHLAPLAKFIR